MRVPHVELELSGPRSENKTVCAGTASPEDLASTSHFDRIVAAEQCSGPIPAALLKVGERHCRLPNPRKVAPADVALLSDVSVTS